MKVESFRHCYRLGRNSNLFGSSGNGNINLFGQFQATDFPREGNWRYNIGTHFESDTSENVQYWTIDNYAWGFIIGVIDGDAVDGIALKMARIDSSGNHVSGSNRMVFDYSSSDTLTQTSLREEYYRDDYGTAVNDRQDRTRMDKILLAIKNDTTGDEWWSFNKGENFIHTRKIKLLPNLL